MNEKMKEMKMNQRCTAHRIVVEGNWDEYMWPHQIDKTPTLDSEVLSFLHQLNLSSLIGIFQNEKICSMEVLLLLEEKDLEKIYIRLGDRKIILRETRKLNLVPSTSSVSSSPPSVTHDLKSDSPFILVSSTSADHQSGMFGLYRKSGEMREDRSIYIQEHDAKYGANSFKLSSYQGTWTIAQDNTMCLSATTPGGSPTSIKWKYKEYNKETWLDDPALTVIGLGEKPRACEVTISLSQDIKMNIKNPGVAGLYREDGSYCLGRPVLHHTRGRFILSVSLGVSGCGWRVRSGVKGALYLMSGSVPTQCPADPRAAGNELWGQASWGYVNKQNRYIESRGIILKKASSKSKVRALSDYEAADVDEISFTEGDEFELILEHETGRWIGKINGKPGFFPGNHVEKI